MDKRTRLFNLINRLSFKRGEFTLASGKKSNYYIDLRNSSLHPESSLLMGELLFELARSNELVPESIAVGGMEFGAVPVALSLACEAHRQETKMDVLVVRKQTKNHGTSNDIEGMSNIPEKSRILVVDDVVSTGKSTKKAIEALERNGYSITGVLSVVDRDMGGREFFASLNLKYHFLFSASDFLAAEEPVEK